MRLKYIHRKISMRLIQTMCPNCITLRMSKKGTHSALALVSEKSASELKHKQKLLKCKTTIQIVAFNVRTFNRIGQQPELTASAVEHNIDTECVQEHKYHHSELEIRYQDTGNGWMLVSASAWKNSVNAVIGGIEMLLSPRALK